MNWDLTTPLHSHFVGRDLLVGEWFCPGGRGRPWSPEVTRYYEIDLLQSGTHLRQVGRERRVFDPTTAAIHRPADEYLFASPTPHPQRSTLLLVRGSLAEELGAIGAGVSTRACHVSPEAARLHARLRRAVDPVAIEETALALVHRILSDARAQPERGRPASHAWRRLAQELQHIVATRFAERLSLADMASACGVSHFHASRVFRAVTGETLHRHLTRVRLRAALFELEHAAGRLTDIALAVGFSSHSHFTRAFRLEFGCAPSLID